MKSTGPYNLALGAQIELVPPDAGVEWDRVVLNNQSGMACEVVGAPWLQAWMGQLYDVTGTDVVYVTPSLLGTPGASNTGQLTADWYQPGETLQGSYPAPLFSQAIAASIAGAVTTMPSQVGIIEQYNNTVPGGATTTFGPFDVRYAGAIGIQYAVGTNGAVAHPCAWEFDWAATSGGSPIYSEKWFMDAPGALAPEAPGLLDVFAPLAGFLTVKVTPTTGAPLLNLLLWAMPLGAAFERPSPIAILQNLQNIPGLASFTDRPGLSGAGFQIPGKAILYVRFFSAASNTGVVACAASNTSTAGAYQSIAAIGSAAQSGNFQPQMAEISVPRSTLQLQVFNNNAAAQSIEWALMSSRD